MENKRVARVGLRLTKDEHSQLQHIAKKNSCTLSNAVRLLLSSSHQIAGYQNANRAAVDSEAQCDAIAAN